MLRCFIKFIPYFILSYREYQGTIIAGTLQETGIKDLRLYC
jgi:hypothetical protein